MTPMQPTVTKLHRQPHCRISSSVMGTASMPPHRDPRNMIPVACPRSRSGNQREKLRAMLGNAPASPAPKKNRIATRDVSPRAVPVSMVNADHQSAIRVSTRRGPYTSPSQPDGISKSEYARVNAPKTRLIWTTVKWSSSMMNGAAAEMQMRSR